MQVIADRKGNLTKVNSTQDKILKKLYHKKMKITIFGIVKENMEKIIKK